MKSPEIFKKNEKIISLWERVLKNDGLFELYRYMEVIAANALRHSVHDIALCQTPVEKGAFLSRVLAEKMPVYIDPSELMATGSILPKDYCDEIIKNIGTDDFEEARKLYWNSRGNSSHTAVDYKKLIDIGIDGIKEELLDAQIHPDLYKNLLVRIAGFTGKFIEWSPAIQNQIIARVK